MKYILFSLFSSFTFLIFSQDSTAVDSIPKNWNLKSIYSLNGTQTSFVNWNSGGRNNISLLGSISASAYYEKKQMKWSNDLSVALGGLQYIEKEVEGGMQKTDDRIDISSILGHKVKEHYYLSIIGGFKTQMIEGFSYPNDSIRVSTFLAPGYINGALGLDYIKSGNFSVFTSPVAMKLTLVKDKTLANEGAFGVEKASYDGVGNLIKAGKHLRAEFGAYIKIKYMQTIAKNIDIQSKLELFSNYLDDPQNIDINADILFNFKVNSWFSASLQCTLIYDDDVDVRDIKGNIGPRTQFKSVLGLGISYKMSNE